MISITNVVMAIVCIGFIGYDLSEVKKFKDKLKEQGKNVRTIERDSKEKLFYQGCCIVCVLVIVLLLIFGKDQLLDLVVFFSVILVIIITAYTSENQSSGLYYTRNGFYLADGFVNFKQVKNVLILSKRKGEVIFNDGKSVRISGKKAINIESIRKVK